MLPSFAQDLSEATLVGEESIFDFSDVPLAFDESAFEYFGVTLAREEDCLGVLPDLYRRCESHFIILTIENISI